MINKKFFCFGKNGFCDNPKDGTCKKCKYADGKGGEYREYVHEHTRLDRSAWEPCEQCRNGSTIIDIPVCNQFGLIHKGKSNEQMHFLFQFPFCPHCGRPLTDAAWEMLEKRLENAK